MSKSVAGLLAGLAVVSAVPLVTGRGGSRNAGSDVSSLQELLGCLRALRWQYHTTHWQVKGASFYGDHLLFQRLYAGEEGGPDLDEQIDGLGERMTRYFGSDTVADSIILPLTQKMLARVEGEGDPIRRAMKLEQICQKQISSAYDTLSSSGRKTLGLDDFLMALADDRDTALYLLGQRLDAPPTFAVEKGSKNSPSVGRPATLAGWPRRPLLQIRDERKRLDARMTGPWQAHDVAVDESLERVMGYVDEWVREQAEEGKNVSSAWMRKWEGGQIDKEARAYLSRRPVKGSKSGCGCGSKNCAGSCNGPGCSCGSPR